MLISTDPDDLVVDLFSGAGSAGVAAKQMGRRYIGCDIDAEYVLTANAEIVRAEAQKTGDVFMSTHLGKVVSVRDVDIDAGGLW